MSNNNDKEEEAPLLNPSDTWKPYTDSHFSEKHLTPREKQIRTSGAFATIANLTKMYVGIAFISGSKSVAQTGIWCAAIGYVYIIAQTIFCIYLLLKARNRFKREEVQDICELGAKLYGGWCRPWIQGLLVATNSCFLMCYCMFIGFNLDQLMCKTFEVAECH